MIMQNELINRLEAKYPGVYSKQVAIGPKNTVYKVMQAFTDIACETIMAKNMQKTNALLTDAYELWNDGCNEVKNAVNNVFLYSLSILMDTKPEKPLVS